MNEKDLRQKIRILELEKKLAILEKEILEIKAQNSNTLTFTPPYFGDAIPSNTADPLHGDVTWASTR